MVDNRGHPNDVNQSNGRQLTLRRSAKDFVAGNTTRRDYPVQSALTTHGKFRVIEKPGVIEAYSISLVPLSTPAVGGNIFTSCLKLLATSVHSEQRIRKYPTEIVVLSGPEDKAALGTPVLVKRLILYKQETSLFVKDNYLQDYFKSYNSCHIRSVSVCETSLSNIVMFATDNRKPCYLADENNQCDCKQFLEQIPCVRQCEKPCERPCEKPCERPCEKPCERPCEKPCERPREEKTCVRPCEKPCERPCEKPCERPREEKPCERPCEKPCGEIEVITCPQSTSVCSNQLQVHVCVFCGQGFIGGNSCGKVCNEFLKQKSSKTRVEKRRKSKPPKKIRFCGCFRKKEKIKTEDVKERELKTNYNKNERLFARVNKPSEMYIKKPYMATDQSLNVISCQQTVKRSEERCTPEKICEPVRRCCCPACITIQCPMPKPCPANCTLRRTAPASPQACQDNPPRGYLSASPCGYPLVSQEKHSPPYGYSVGSPENSNPPIRQDKACNIRRCKPPVCLEKVSSPCSITPVPPVCQERAIHPCRCTPPQPVCQQIAADVCKCCKDCLPRSTSKTQVYKSKSERLVGKRFHLICQKFESSDEDSDLEPNNPKPPKDKMHNAVARRPSSPESTELSEDIRNDIDNKAKTETKVGRVEINYCKSYYPSKARLQRDNIPLKKRNYSTSSTYSTSKTKYSMSSSNSNVSYLSIGGKKIKQSKFPVKIEDCRSCYLKVCKHGKKKKTIFCYSSGCSIKKVS